MGKEWAYSGSKVAELGESGSREDREAWRRESMT